MSKPAFIVDGYTEVKIIQRICPGIPVQRTDLNGKSVKIAKIIDRIFEMIRLLGNRHYPIIILIDKEERNISYNTIADQIFDGLRAKGIKEDIRVGVADIMLENWIVADWLSFTGESNKQPKKCDGINGAALIKKTKGHYNKTTDGVDYFVKSKSQEIYKNSPSFKHFADQLVDLNCDFFMPVNL